MITLTADAAYGHSGQYVARILGRHSKWTFEREFIGRKCGKRKETTEADVDTAGLYECCSVDRKGNKNSKFFVLAEVNEKCTSFWSSKEDAMVIAKELDKKRPFGDIVAIQLSDEEAVREMEAWDDAKEFLARLEGLPDSSVEVCLEITVGEHARGTLMKGTDLLPLVQREAARLAERVEAMASEGRLTKNRYVIVTQKESKVKDVIGAVQARTEENVVDGSVQRCWAVLSSLSAADARAVLTILDEKLKQTGG